MGESCAACKISSEYAFPIPSTIRGSVSARFNVWFSPVSAARNESRSAANTSIPPASNAARPASPPTTCNDARCLLPASVSTSEPRGKSNAARFCLPPSFASRFFQCSRPAIIKCSTSQRSPPSPNAMRFPIRRNRSTTRSSALVREGWTVRNRNGLFSRTRSNFCPTTRGSSAMRYAQISGSSGTPISLPRSRRTLQSLAVRQLSAEFCELRH